MLPENIKNGRLLSLPPVLINFLLSSSDELSEIRVLDIQSLGDVLVDDFTVVAVNA